MRDDDHVGAAGSDNSRGAVSHRVGEVREPDLAWGGLISILARNTRRRGLARTRRRNARGGGPLIRLSQEAQLPPAQYPLPAEKPRHVTLSDAACGAPWLASVRTR